jgi:hypothetical protein
MVLDLRYQQCDIRWQINLRVQSGVPAPVALEVEPAGPTGYDTVGPAIRLQSLVPLGRLVKLRRHVFR